MQYECASGAKELISKGFTYSEFIEDHTGPFLKLGWPFCNLIFSEDCKQIYLSLFDKYKHGSNLGRSVSLKQVEWLLS